MILDEIIALLSKHRAELQRLGVKDLAIFGSVARNQARPDSDVDVLVEFDKAATFDAYMDVKFFLEDLLHRQVDLVTQKALKPGMRPTVENEAVHVA